MADSNRSKRVREYAQQDSRTLADMLIQLEDARDRDRSRMASLRKHARELRALVTSRMRQNSKGDYAEWSDGTEVSPSFRIVIRDLDDALAVRA